MIQINKDCFCERRFQNGVFWLVVYFLMYILVYFPMCNRHSLHQDEVLDWQGQAIDTYLVAGRWALYLFRIVFDAGCHMLTAGLISGVLLSAALVIHTHMLGVHSSFAKLAYGALYMSCSQWGSILEYRIMCDAVAFALFGATVAGYLWYKEKNLMPAALILAFSLGVYQTAGIFFFVLCAVCLIRHRLMNWYMIRRFLFICILGLGVYVLVQKLMMAIVPIPQETLDYVLGYQQSVTQWEPFGQLDFSAKFLFILHYAKNTLIDALGFGKNSSLADATVSIAALLLVLHEFRSRNRGSACLCSALILFVWYVPYVLPLITGTEIGERVQLAAPLRTSSFWCLVASFYAINGRLIPVLGAGICFLLFKSSYRMSSYVRDKDTAYLQGVKELQRIYDTSQHLARTNQLGNCEIIILGRPAAVPDTSNDFLSQLVHSRTGSWYMKHYNMPMLRFASGGDALRYENEARDMPSWPAPDSIRCVHGRVIVKLFP